MKRQTAKKRQANKTVFLLIIISALVLLIGIYFILASERHKSADDLPGIRTAYKDVPFISQTDVNKAASICESSDIKDSCYMRVAVASKNPEICELITVIATKDGCYADFAVENDFSVCVKISDPDLRKACDSMKLYDEGIAET